MIQLLRDLVAIESVNTRQGGRPGAERQIGDFLEGYLRRQGFEVARQGVAGEADNILVLHEAARTAPWLLFVSHMDTVSAENMTIAPFDPVVRDARLYGRGSCDTKSSAAAMIHALMDHRAAAGPKANVALLFSVDEEMGKRGITRFCAEIPTRPGGAIAGAVVGEPTSLRGASAHCGVLRFAIEAQGVAAHSSRPELGRSAISGMLKIISRLEGDYIPGLSSRVHPLCGGARCSINTIRGGTSVNIIPERCTIEVDRRLLPGEEARAVFADIRRSLEPLASTVRFSVMEPFLVDAPLSPATSAFPKQVAAALKSLDLPAEAIGVGFGSEASDLAAQGIPTLVLGPGSIDQAHQAVEWVELRQLEAARAVYRGIMRECAP